jgi:hypothetical protein
MLLPTTKIENDAFSYSGFLIRDQNREIIDFNAPAVTFADDNRLCSGEYSLYTDSIKKNTYKSLGVTSNNISYVDNYIKHSFILHPKERKTFKIILYLPMIKEINSKTGDLPVFYKDLNETQTFELFYSCEGVELERVLPQYLLDDIKANDVEIYSGVLESNYVPLKLKK